MYVALLKSSAFYRETGIHCVVRVCLVVGPTGYVCSMIIPPLETYIGRYAYTYLRVCVCVCVVVVDFAILCCLPALKSTCVNK